jgi:hypothetical protein
MFVEKLERFGALKCNLSSGISDCPLRKAAFPSCFCSGPFYAVGFRRLNLVEAFLALQPGNFSFVTSKVAFAFVAVDKFILF